MKKMIPLIIASGLSMYAFLLALKTKEPFRIGLTAFGVLVFVSLLFKVSKMQNRS